MGDGGEGTQDADLKTSKHAPAFIRAGRIVLSIARHTCREKSRRSFCPRIASQRVSTSGRWNSCEKSTVIHRSANICGTTPRSSTKCWYIGGSCDRISSSSLSSVPPTPEVVWSNDTQKLSRRSAMRLQKHQNESASL